MIAAAPTLLDARFERMVFQDGYDDPYDLWATRAGVASRARFYEGRLSGKLGAASIALADWALPGVSRRALRCLRRTHPITVAQAILTLERVDPARLADRAEDALRLLERLAAVRPEREDADGEWSWGLGFPWMSKNGLYGEDIPFVTHTPYVMEALLAIASLPGASAEARDRARELFDGTWAFLERLEVKVDADHALALSYAPVDEPRIVVNANAYAALAFALHAVHGRDERRDLAAARAARLAAWVREQQSDAGAWTYYADRDAGNFNDCFHSCFVVKNLLKTAELLPHLEDETRSTADAGWRFIRDSFLDERRGLFRRFVSRSHRDPFRWDLYDQAEGLGLLARLGGTLEFEQLGERMLSRFRAGGHWHCRVDVLGRRWGRDFLRWGIVPFVHAACGSSGKSPVVAHDARVATENA